MGIVNCDLTMKQCSMEWEDLEIIEDNDNRFCNAIH